jgi:aminobenzoyl-glutamate utilization protein B
MMTRTEVKPEFLEGSHNVIPNQVISGLIVDNMREIGLPHHTAEDLRFGENIAKTITSEMKVAQLKKSKRPGWEKLADKLVDDEIVDPWGEGEVMHGSTDVADVSWQAPTVEFGTATWVLGTPAHSWQATAQSGVGIGHKSLIFAAKVMAATAIDLLTNKDVLGKAREEHQRRIGDKKYRSPIPADNKPPVNIWKE